MFALISAVHRLWREGRGSLPYRSARAGSRAADAYISDEIIKETEEDLPDKEQLRVAIEENSGLAPDKAKLLRRVSLSYRRRKRIKKGV